MTEEKKVTPQDYFNGFPEAPASDTFKWIDGNGIEHMTTLRAWSGSGLYKVISEFEAQVIESGGRSAMPQQAPKPTSAPAAQTNATGTTMKVGKIKVTPEASRIVIDLFEAGHKYPDIKAFFKTADEAKIAFGMVTGADFSIAGEYELECLADYRLSDKLNTKGNPYKNLVSVSPII